MSAQPASDAGGIPIRQEIDDGVPFEVDDHGAVAAPALPSPLVDADDARFGADRYGRSTHEAQERVAAHWHGKAMGQAGSGRTAQREAEMPLEFGQPLGPAGVRLGVIHALAEGPPRAGRVQTAEASQPKP